MKSLLRLLAAALITFGASLHAETPEDVVARQLAAMRAGDWNKFTACMDIPALKEFQASMLSVLNAAPAEGPRAQMLKAFFADQTIPQLTAATPATFFAAFMHGLTNSNPIIKQGMASADGQILGHIDEAPDKAHVVMRMSVPVGEGKVTKMDVTSLRRDGDTWKALLKGDMQAIVANLSKALQTK